MRSCHPEIVPIISEAVEVYLGLCEEVQQEFIDLLRFLSLTEE
jgi:hypothetical protein